MDKPVTSRAIERGLQKSVEHEVQIQARKYTPRALKVLADIMEDPDAGPARVAAAKVILTFGWGIPKSVDTGGGGGGGITIVIEGARGDRQEVNVSRGENEEIFDVH
jgi:hypothetical protein